MHSHKHDLWQRGDFAAMRGVVHSVRRARLRHNVYACMSMRHAPCVLCVSVCTWSVWNVGQNSKFNGSPTGTPSIEGSTV